MRVLVSLLVSVLFASTLFAQSIDQVSVSNGYTLQTFYDVKSGNTKSIDGDSWDISFSVLGLQDAAISVNEASPSMGVELELYYIGEVEFDAIISEEELTERIYNDESNWLAGAFNATKDPSNFADYGWGTYDPGTMTVIGNKLFVIKLRNGLLKRIKIESLIGTVYNIITADFDGSNQKTISIDKNDFSGKQRAFYSFESDSILDLEPQDWDLVFTRYSSPVDDGQGNILNYVVTGVLSADGVEIAEANGINPLTVLESDFSDQYDSSSDVIGYDWKEIDITTFQWSLVLDRVYFLKTKEGEKFKLYLFDFEGSSTGVTSIEKTEINTTSNSAVFGEDSFRVYPNPSNGSFQLELNIDFEELISIKIHDMSGRLLFDKKDITIAKKETIGLEENLPSGSYFVSIQTLNKIFVKKIVVL